MNHHLKTLFTSNHFQAQRSEKEIQTKNGKRFTEYSASIGSKLVKNFSFNSNTALLQRHQPLFDKKLPQESLTTMR